MAGRVKQDPKAYLKGLAAKWGEAAKEGKIRKAGSKFEDGTYEGRVMNAGIKPSAKGQQMMVYDILFVNGEYAGETVNKYAGMDGEDSAIYIAQDLMAFEIDPEEISPEDFDDILANIAEEKPYIQFRLWTGTKGFQNVYFNKMLDADEVEDEVGEGGDSIEEGSRVTFVKNKKAGAGEVVTVVDEDTVKVRNDDGGKIVTLNIEGNEVQLEVAEEEDEAGTEDEDDDAEETPGEGELAEGQKVKYTAKGESRQGIVLELLEDEEKVRIQEHDEDWDSTGKIHRVGVDVVAIIPETDEAEKDDDSSDDEEEEEAPAPKRGGKAPAKPAAKPAAAAAAKKPTAKPGRK